MTKPTLRVVKTPTLIHCPKCEREMCLRGIERESESRDLYTFECESCRVIEVRGVRVS
jgi:predicted  nucleic acid-binding Zn ribbon protein